MPAVRDSAPKHVARAPRASKPTRRGPVPGMSWRDARHAVRLGKSEGARSCQLSSHGVRYFFAQKRQGAWAPAAGGARPAARPSGEKAVGACSRASNARQRRSAKRKDEFLLRKQYASCRLTSLLQRWWRHRKYQHMWNVKHVADIVSKLVDTTARHATGTDDANCAAGPTETKLPAHARQQGDAKPTPPRPVHPGEEECRAPDAAPVRSAHREERSSDELLDAEVEAQWKRTSERQALWPPAPGKSGPPCGRASGPPLSYRWGPQRWSRAGSNPR